MQDKRDTGQEGCRKGGFRKGGMQKGRSQDWRYWKGWFRTVEIWNGRDARVDRRDKGKLGGRTGGMQDRMELEPEGFRTGDIQDWRDAGKGDSGKEEGMKGGM